MPATMTAPRKRKRNARKAEPVPGPRTGSDGGDAWLETPETAAALAEMSGAAKNPRGAAPAVSFEEFRDWLYSL